jgi:hypothetical protein
MGNRTSPGNLAALTVRPTGPVPRNRFEEAFPKGQLMVESITIGRPLLWKKMPGKPVVKNSPLGL